MDMDMDMVYWWRVTGEEGEWVGRQVAWALAAHVEAAEAALRRLGLQEPGIETTVLRPSEEAWQDHALELRSEPLLE